jgi:hypothetical protein
MRPRASMIKRYRTRILGYVIVVIGSLQAAGPHFADMLSERAYNWLMIVLGILVALVGHSNARRR